MDQAIAHRPPKTAKAAYRPFRPGGRSWRVQAASLYLAEVLCQAAQDNRYKHYKIDESILSRLWRWTTEAKAWVVPMPELPMLDALSRMVWERNQIRAWDKIFNRLTPIVRHGLVSNPEAGMVAIVGSLLTVFEDVYAQVPVERKREWGYLVQAVTALYRRVDPDFTSTEAELAQRIGEQIKEVIFS